MRSLCLLVLGAFPALAAGPFTFGLKGGVPLTDFTNAVSSGRFDYTSNTQRYIVGPTAELRLPFGLGVEVDALYRHFNYNAFLTGTGVSTSTTGSAWEFPVLAKYRFPAPIARPYILGGVAWDTLSGLKQDVSTALSNAGVTSRTPTELNKSTDHGFRARRRPRRARADRAHLARNSLHALGREAFSRSERQLQQQSESGGVSGRHHLLGRRSTWRLTCTSRYRARDHDSACCVDGGGRGRRGRAGLFVRIPAIHRGNAVLWHDPGAVERLDLRYGAGGRALQPRPPFRFVKEDTSGSTPESPRSRRRGPAVGREIRRGVPPRHVWLANGLGARLLHRDQLLRAARCDSAERTI